MNQTVIMLNDMRQDVADALKYVQGHEALVNVKSALLHMETAEHQLRRAITLEEATHERLFDQEQDISDYEGRE